VLVTLHEAAVDAVTAALLASDDGYEKADYL